MNDFDKRRTWGPVPVYPNVVASPRGPFGDMIVLAGPCSVESTEQIQLTTRKLRDAGATFARGGVYRAGTYPREVFGLQLRLLNEWHRECRKLDLPIVVEVLDIRQVDCVAQRSEAFQVGARHMQDYALLKELAQFGRPVFLKRNPGATLDEFLGAAEYLAGGKCKPVLIERGSSTHMNHVRWDLSISLIAAVKRMTGLPILVDASHGTGRRDLVLPMTLAGIAAGADGFLVEVHHDPDNSLSDADQACPLGELEYMVARAREVKGAATCAMDNLGTKGWGRSG